MSARLAGRVVIVTGASAGIGRDTAVRLMSKGATVVGAARDLDRLRQVDGIDPVRCDVADDADRAALVEHALDRHGRVDALVNNAGLGWHGRFEEMPGQQVQYLFDVNVVGLIDLCRRVLPGMLERGRGDIVNVSSVAGIVAFPPYSVYCATKFAVNGFTDGLRREVRHRGVKVHLITPGNVRTEWEPRAMGYRPDPGAPEQRASKGVAAMTVARAIERCLTRPWPRIASVPRVLGVARAANAFGVRQGMDLAGRTQVPKG
jgi:NADP-dependent 3-hydroxy acid dehydrogenase YdfG